MKLIFLATLFYDALATGGGGTDPKAQLLADIKGQVEGELNKRGYTSKDDVNAIITEKTKSLDGISKADIDTLRSDLTKTAADLQKLKDNGLAGGEPVKSIRAQVKEWQTRNKEVIERIKAGHKADLPALELRAAATMVVGTNVGTQAVMINGVAMQPGVVDLNRNQATFWNMLPKGRTNQASYTWVNKVNKEGNAAFIGEGVLKPLASFHLDPEISNAKKVAERMKASTEILEDVEGMASLIEDELRYEVEMAVQTALLTGTASSTSPAGITTVSSAFTLTTIETPNPTYADAVRAAVAQLRSLNFTQNVVAFINPIDGANMDLAKASDSGVYMLPPFTTPDGRTIAGVRVIEDNNIAVGNLLVADLSKYKVLIYKDYTVSWGWENDDFSKNLVTVIGEMRIHQFVSANHTGAFIYDSFADILAAIAAA